MGCMSHDWLLMNLGFGVMEGGAISLLASQIVNEYLFTVTGVKKMKWFLSLTRCHFQPRVTEGHEWLEMAPSEK